MADLKRHQDLDRDIQRELTEQPLGLEIPFWRQTVNYASSYIRKGFLDPVFILLIPSEYLFRS